MATTVEIGFNLAPNGVGNWFTLDNTTKGALDNTTYKLAGDVLTDVTTYVREVSIKRGRSRQLEKFTAATAQVTLDNRNRYFDPLYTASPYYGNIGPRKALRIAANGVPIWRGNVEDWDYDYDMGGDSTATVKGIDGFALLAKATLSAGTMTAQKTGARIGTVLTTAGWDPNQRAISTGAATLDADVVKDDEPLLGYLQTVELSEPGALFIGSDGAFTFRDRTYMQTYSSGAVFGPSGIPFEDFSVVFGTEEQWNTVNVTYTAGSVVGGTAIAQSAASTALYGVMEQTYNTLLGAAGDAESLADWFVAKYADPLWRVDSVTINVNAITAAQVTTVLNLDLADVVQVSWTPNSIGSAITQYATIDGIEHSIGAVEHRITFTLSETIAAFILDDAVFGKLDSNILGF